MSFRGAVSGFHGWLMAPADPRRLAAVRIGLFSLLALRLATNDYGEVADQPRALFDPVSLFHLIPEMPSSELTSACQLVGVIAAILAAAGRLPRLTFPLAFGAALFLGLMLNSTGKIMHNDVLLMLCLVPLLLNPRAATVRWSLAGQRRQDHRIGPRFGWPVQLAMLIVGLSYLFAGLQKLRFAGIEWVTSDNLRWTLEAASTSGGGIDGLGSSIADLGLIVHFAAAGALLLELTFILCVPFPRLRWVFVPGVCLLHLGILATMGIDYTGQIATVLIVFVNWPVVIDAILGRAQRPRKELPSTFPESGAQR